MKNYFLKTLIITLTISLLSNICFSQETNQVNWISLEEAEEKQKETPKTILIDMYTDWCGWCKRMDETTFNNPAIANYINTHFYAVKFNAESRDTITYMGEVYTNESSGPRPSHKLAQVLMGGRMSYPTIVYIDNNFRAYPVPGYMDPTRMEAILVYFAERINHVADFADFDIDYKNTFDPEFSQNIEGEVKWLEYNDGMDKMNEDPKKLILYLNSEYNNSSKLMKHSVLKHPVIADNINQNFHTIEINYDTKDTLIMLGNAFVNQGDQLGYPHQLTIALLQPEIRMPAIVFINDDLTLIHALRGYYPPKVIERYLSFISQNLYIDGNWEEFNESFISEIEE